MNYANDISKEECKMFNLKEFTNDLTIDLKRVTTLKRKARMQGKRSKARINTKKLSKKYGLSNDGYKFLDVVAGYSIFNTLELDEKDSVLQAIEQSKDLLEKELGYNIFPT